MITLSSHFDLNNLFSIIIIFIYIGAINFAWLLPLYVYLKKSVLALQFVIPISLSIQIIFGYIFYSFAASSWYILPYFLLVLAANIFFLRQMGFKKFFQMLPKLIPKTSRGYLLFVVLLISLIIFTRFYDSLSTVAPGNNDTYNHIQFLKSIKGNGYISVTYYAPGFHLLLLPLTFALPYSEIYRFVGPVLGCYTVLALWLLLKPAFRKKSSHLILLAVLLLPVFNPLTIQTIGFFSSSLSFIYLAAFLMLLGFANNRPLPGRYVITISLTIALALTVPYFFVQYTVALGLLLLVGVLNHHLLTKDFIKRLAIMVLISLSGIIIGYLHVALQTSLHSSIYFPSIDDQNKIERLSSFSNNWFITNNLSPLISSGFDLVSIKAIRSPQDLLGAGAYVWIFIASVLLIVSLIQKRRSLFVISFISIVYGIITQTGMFELTTYKGRSGWYLLLLAAFGMIFVYDRFKLHTSERLVLPILMIFAITSIVFPPRYYRPYHIEQFEALADITSTDKAQPVVYSNLQEFALVDDRIRVIPFTQTTIDLGLEEDSIVILDKVAPEVDPIKSQQALATDKGFNKFILSNLKEIENENHSKQIYIEAGGCDSLSILYQSSNSIICSTN